MAIDFKNSETKDNLMRAFAGESQARNRYTFGASQAMKEKQQAIAQVFIYTANQEKEHAEIFYKHLKELGKLAELKGEWIDYQCKLDKVEEVKTPKSDLTSHTARRTFVVTALNEGVELDLIAQITSHSDIVAIVRGILFSLR